VINGGDAGMSGRRGSPTAILFDFGGTLDAPGLPWKERMFRLYRAEGVNIAPAEFDPVFYGADDALVGHVPATLGFRETIERLTTGVGGALAVRDERVNARVAKRFVEDSLDCIRGQRDLLSQLAQRYRLGIVSNFYGNLATVCEELDLRPLFKVMVDSVDVGVEKPDPRIFRHALDGLGVEPEDATFVGDSRSRDMEGARGIGMPHVWLCGDASVRPEPCCRDDRLIATLGELRELFL
jgi:putative hydrolase of the HAD superfamily